MSQLPEPNERDELRQLVAAFRTAEEYIAALVQGIAVDRGLARAIRAQRARTARAFARAVRRDLDSETRDYLRRHLPRVYLDGMTQAALQAGSGLPIEWTLLHKRAITLLVADTFADVAAATAFMEANAVRAIRQATRAETLRQVATGRGNVAERLVAELERRAVTGFTDRAGRRWRLSRYASMVLRTKRQQAYNTGAVLRHQQQGTVGMRIVDGTRDDDACREANGSTCSLAWALANPLQHPNCTRTFAPLNRVPLSGFDFGDANDTIVPPSGTNPSSAISYPPPPNAPAEGAPA